MILSRLTRIYERRDVQRAVTIAAKQRVKVIRRNMQKQKNKQSLLQPAEMPSTVPVDAKAGGISRTNLVAPLCTAEQLAALGN